MKKILALLLALGMMLPLAACGGKNDSETNSTQPADSVRETTELSTQESTPLPGESTDEPSTKVIVEIPSEYVGTYEVLWGGLVVAFPQMSELKIEKDGTLSYSYQSLTEETIINRSYAVEAVTDDNQYLYNDGKIILSLTSEEKQPINLTIGENSLAGYGVTVRKIGSGEKKIVDLTVENWQEYLTPEIIYDIKKDSFDEPNGEMTVVFCLIPKDSIDVLSVEGGIVKARFSATTAADYEYNTETGAYVLKKIDNAVEEIHASGETIKIGESDETEIQIAKYPFAPLLYAAPLDYVFYKTEEDNGIIKCMIVSEYEVEVQNIKGTITYVEKD